MMHYIRILEQIVLYTDAEGKSIEYEEKPREPEDSLAEGEKPEFPDHITMHLQVAPQQATA